MSSPKSAVGLRAYTKRVLKKVYFQAQYHPTRIQGHQITKMKLVQIILTAYKGMAIIVMGRQDYMNKVQELLGDQGTYRPISKDPTPKL